ncbi:MAG: tripartite tricarboxylate transporter TctB family protein [Meiothermus sp.]|uniref:tripartite tricarboxylate transporter TctB family protein n=1 Tax=Meiothermus sp. TaxID=1955249 RepID=UPI0025FE0233|nr:tripartite tricarboxylate transporter TctB family protein [Meiothermus sp.]MCS7057316.1 tripartite tricarboxylate transporter TctB family protein [Meiothermus sp.]MCS7194765.1 tripartite tricarboxylate transporter TctB family protein [Meiothermus sp.]MDW8091250.1 tripartite tricarboxylate transporter TctB family protein [Meiothermus sp.]MDW8480369.1 tripartite tricarboxylate transporter TctB family protein [Meiothermus sp.]
MTDRVVGFFLLLLATGYALEAARMEVSFFTDPLGPRPFPYIIAALMGLSSLWLIAKPDPEPAWPPRRFWLVLGLVLLSLVAYAHLVVPLGFVVATTLEMTLLSRLFGARLGAGFLSALAFSLGVYLLFTEVLGVGLPVGRLFG